jgi:hypothetical protein
VRSLKSAIILVIIFVAFPAAATADVIVFKSGTAKVGIIQEETPTTVKIRVKDVVIGVSRTNIERIERATPEKNQQLEEKWKEEKEQLAEERAKRREEAARFEAEQKEKGLVNVDGKWVSPAEAERVKQQATRKQIEAQAAGTAGEAAEKPEESEETPVPEIINELPNEELKKQALEGLERQKKIEVSQIQVKSLGGNQSAFTGTVTNRSDTFAQRVDLEIRNYDDAGEIVDVQTTSVMSLKPGESKALDVPVRLDSSLIKQTKALIVSVEWR